MNLYLYKPFQKQLAKLERSGGVATMACREVYSAINNWRHRLPVTLSRTKHGESRIPHAVKYDLHGHHRLVTVEHDAARILVCVGSHDDVDHWLDVNRGAQFVVNKRGQVDFTRVEPTPADFATLEDTVPESQLLTGPVLRQLPTQTLALLGLPESVTLTFELITFDVLADNSKAWQLIHAQPYEDDSQRSAAIDAVDHLRHGRLKQAIARIEAYAGEATPNPSDVVTALETGSATDTLANLTALSDEDFEHRFRNSTYAEWLLFLHPEQRKHVTASHAGPSRLIGVSGSGKTCVLVHRASELAARYPGERILILVLNESLRQLLERLVDHLCPESQRHQIEVMRIYDYCHRAVKTIRPRALINRYDPHSGEDLVQCWRDFTNRPHAKAQSVTLRANIKAMLVEPWGYLHDELIWVRTGTGARKAERKKYLYVERVGRALQFPVVERGSRVDNVANTTTGFRPDTRVRVLQLLGEYEEYMAEGGLLDEDGVALLAYEHRDQIAKHPALQARCVLVDESQDLSTTQLGVISRIPTEDTDGLMIVGDPVQKVFPRQQHLKSAEIDIRGRAARLNINYRNTRQILDAAYPIINTYRGLSPVPAEEVLEPEMACRTGPRPQLIICRSVEEQWQCVEFLVGHLRSTGAPSVCVGSPRPAIEAPARKKRTQQVQAASKPLVDKTLLGICERNNWPVMAIEGKGKLDALAESVVGAKFEDMKGFEFRNVVLVDLQDRPLLPDSIPFKEYWRVAFQLYVAMTRAQEGLWLFAVNTPSKLLSSLGDFVDRVTPDQLLGHPPRVDEPESDALQGNGRLDGRRSLPPIPKTAQLQRRKPASPPEPSATNEGPGSERDADPDDRPLPFNAKRTTTKRLVQYAFEYMDDIDVFEPIMLLLRDRDTTGFGREMSELSDHWLTLVQRCNPNNPVHDSEPEWPSQALLRRTTALTGDVFPHAEGMLSFMGYQVGITSDLTPTERRSILWYVYRGDLPFVLSRSYTEEWGAPASAKRLAKMTITISAFIENARRRRTDMRVAIAEWQDDLAYIKRHFK
jgi:superfamily I DNA/RNA helicase